MKYLPLFLFCFQLFAQDSLDDAFFGNVNGHDISSFEPCVHREQSGGWYDHCFFNMNGTNSFGDKVSTEAKDCALKANKKLYSWLSEKDSPVERAYSILEKVYGKKYLYMIVTDTVGTTIPGKSRESSSLWTWKGSNGEGDYFKFNIGISKTGKCSIPTEEDMISTIKRWVGFEKFNEVNLALNLESSESIGQVDLHSDSRLEQLDSSRGEETSFVDTVRNYLSNLFSSASEN